MPKVVSIIMPCFNAARYLDRSIRSVLEQTFGDWELIIVDDASTDDSVSKIQEWMQRDDRIRLRKMAQNGGPSAARNAAIEIAEGEWIAVLDADDAYRPNRLERLVALAREADADFAFDNLVLFDDFNQSETGAALPEFGPPIPLDFKALVNSEGPKTRFKLGFLKPLMNKSFLDAHALRYTTKFRFAEDFDLDARAFLEGARAIFTPEPFYLYTTQVGKNSGKKSSGSQTVFDPEIRVTMASELIETYRDRISPDDMWLLKQLLKWQIMYSDVVRMSKCRRAWDGFGFFRIALNHPSSLFYYILTSRAARALKGKLVQ